MADIDDTNDDGQILEPFADMNEALKDEVAAWDELGVLYNQVINVNMVGLDNWLKTLTQMLIDAELIDEAEFREKRDSNLAKFLKMVREQVTPKIRQARLAAKGIELPTMHIPGKKLH